MKKKNKKRNDSSAHEKSQLEVAVGSFNWRLLLMLIGNTIIVFAIYRIALNFIFFEFVLGAYMLITLGLVLGYVIYNRGFSRRGITVDMLPDSMSYEEKQEFVADAERRAKKSKWMLTLILPFVLTFLFDAVELFFGDYFKGIFG